MYNDYMRNELKKEGIALGRDAERYRIAQNLSYIGLDFELIYLTTQLPKEEIVQIKKDHSRIKSSIRIS